MKAIDSKLKGTNQYNVTVLDTLEYYYLFQPSRLVWHRALWQTTIDFKVLLWTRFFLYSGLYGNFVGASSAALAKFMV